MNALTLTAKRVDGNPRISFDEAGSGHAVGGRTGFDYPLVCPPHPLTFEGSIAYSGLRTTNLHYGSSLPDISMKLEADME